MSTLQIPTARVFLPLLENKAPDKFPTRYKGIWGGRSSAKSHFFAGLWLEENISEKLDFVCLREIQKSLEFSVRKLLVSKIEAHNAGAYFEVLDKKITSKLGGVTLFQGLQDHTAESIKSLEGFDRAWVEEAQSLSQGSLDILRPTIRKAGSQIWFSWNPKNEGDPVDAFLRGPNKPPGSIIIKANYRDNPWLPEESKRDLEYDQRRDPDKFAHIWLGEYQRNSEARVFRNWTIEEFERPLGTIFRLGADWGFSVDPTVLIRCSIDGNRLYVDHEAYMVGCEIVNLPDLFSIVPESTKWFITADSARPETISHMRQNGYPKISPAIKGPKSLEEGVEFLKSFDIVVNPRCIHTIDELTLYSYKVSKEVDPKTGQNRVLPILTDKKNHVIDALRYACEGIRRANKGERKSIPLSSPAASPYS